MANAVLKIGADISEFKRALGNANSSLSAFARGVGAIATGQFVFSGINAAVGSFNNLLRDSVRLASDFEAYQSIFRTFYQDANKAGAALDILRKYADSTSFQLDEVVRAGVSLAGVSTPVEQLGESIRLLGDLAAATQRPLVDMVNPYIKVLSLGYMQTEEVLQFLEKGIPIADTLKQRLRVTNGEFQMMIEKGQVTAKMVVDALQAITSKGIFAGAATDQASTLRGRLSTLGDAWASVKRNVGLGMSSGLKELSAVGMEIADTLLPAASRFGNVLSGISKNLLEFGFLKKDSLSSIFESGLQFLTTFEGALREGNAWEIVKLSGEKAFSDIKIKAMETLQGVMGIIAAQGQDNTFGEAIASAFDRVVNISTKSLKSLLSQFNGIIASLEGLFDEIQNENFSGKISKTITSAISEGIKNAFKSPLENMAEAIGKGFDDAFGSIPSEIAQGFDEAFGSASDEVAQAFKNAFPVSAAIGRVASEAYSKKYGKQTDAQIEEEYQKWLKTPPMPDKRPEYSGFDRTQINPFFGLGKDTKLSDFIDLSSLDKKISDAIERANSEIGPRQQSSPYGPQLDKIMSLSLQPFVNEMVQKFSEAMERANSEIGPRLQSSLYGPKLDKIINYDTEPAIKELGEILKKGFEKLNKLPEGYARNRYGEKQYVGTESPFDYNERMKAGHAEYSNSMRARTKKILEDMALTPGWQTDNAQLGRDYFAEEFRRAFEEWQKSTPRAAGYYGEAIAAAEAGYPVPLRPSEVKETFIRGRRSSYNTRERLVNGMIIPPFAEGYNLSGGGGFKADFSKVTTSFLNAMNVDTAPLRRARDDNAEVAKKLNAALKKAAEGAVVFADKAFKVKEQKELTAKTEGKGVEEKGKKKTAKAEDDRFTSIERLGGGARKVSLKAKPAIEGEGLLPATLKPAMPLTGGFGDSAKMQQAKEKIAEAKRRQAEELAERRDAALQKMRGGAIETGMVKKAVTGTSQFVMGPNKAIMAQRAEDMKKMQGFYAIPENLRPTFPNIKIPKDFEPSNRMLRSRARESMSPEEIQNTIRTQGMNTGTLPKLDETISAKLDQLIAAVVAQGSLKVSVV